MGNVYWYAYRLRGFSLGCQPRGFVDHNDDYGKWGAIAYNHPLSKEEMDEYELDFIEVIKQQHINQSNSSYLQKGE